MTQAFYITIFWGITIIFSLIGWGLLLNKILFKKSSFEFGILGTLGIALSIVIGGVLNLLSVISKPLIISYIIIGLFLCIWILVNDKYSFKEVLSGIKKYSLISKILLTLIILLTSFHFLASLFTTRFNPHDDYQAYFVFPQKMIQSGSLGSDPFSERRIITSLGGKYFMDTFTLATMSYKNLGFMDQGCAYIFWVLLLFDLTKKKKVPTALKLISILAILLVAIASVNITSLVMSMILLLTLIYYLFDQENLQTKKQYLTNAIVVSLLFVALIVSKTTMAPIALGLMFVSLLLNFQKLNRKPFQYYITIVLLSALLILPWMIAMKQSCGTFFYPLLGEGYYGTAYGNFSSGYSGSILTTINEIIQQIRIEPYYIFSIFLFLIFINIFANFKSKNLIIKFSLIGFVTVFIYLLNGIYTGAYGMYRYSYPYVLTIIVYLIIQLTEKYDHNIFDGFKKLLKKDLTDLLNIKYIYVILFVSFLFVNQGSRSLLREFKINFTGIKNGGIFYNNVISPEIITSYNSMQTALPRKEYILERLEYPFLLNYKYKNIYIADYPGGQSLPPGIPLQSGPKALKLYLIKNHINYIAYSYSNEANFTKKQFGDRLASTANPWIRSEAQNTFDFQDLVSELMKSEEIIFLDEENVLIKLN